MKINKKDKTLKYLPKLIIGPSSMESNERKRARSALLAQV